MPPRGRLVMSGDIFVATWWVGEWTLLAQYIETRAAAKPPTRHRTAPITKDDLAQNINGAKVEKPSPKM